SSLLLWFWFCFLNNLVDSFPLKTVTKKYLGNYSKEELQALVQETLEPFSQNHKIPHIYISEEAEPNASTMNTIFFSAWKPFNSVHISSGLLSILQPNELKAILLHELAHFFHYMWPLRRMDFFVYLFLGLLPAYLFLQFEATSFFIFVLWGSAVYFCCLLTFGMALVPQSKDMEFLADLFSAKHSDKLSAVNSLLIMGKGSEAMERITRKFLLHLFATKDLPYDAIYEFDDLLAKFMPKKIVTAEEDAEILTNIFNHKSIQKSRKKLTAEETQKKKKGIKKELKEFSGKKKFRLLDWSTFANASQDMRVNEYEYPQLIDALHTHPQEQLFNLASDNPKANKNEEHPTFTHRILFLEKNCS
ncbi:MAG: M48 family metalloprotease, partial [Spirochaetota bacterium]